MPNLTTIEALIVTELEKLASVHSASFDPQDGRPTPETGVTIECFWGSSTQKKYMNGVADEQFPINFIIQARNRVTASIAQDVFVTWLESVAIGSPYQIFRTSGIPWTEYDSRTPPLPTGQGELFIALTTFNFRLRYT